MLKPKKFKFKKIQNSKKKRIYSYQSCKTVSYNFYNNIFFFSKESGLITSIQLEIGFKLIQKILKNSSFKVTLCAFPQKPISKKPIGVRIGKGKGSVSSWVVKTTFGINLYKITGFTNLNFIYKIQTTLSKKLPIYLGIRFFLKIILL